FSSLTWSLLLCFFSHVTSTTAIYTLSLHDALPIFAPHFLYLLFGVDIGDNQENHIGQEWEKERNRQKFRPVPITVHFPLEVEVQDRKSTRLNSSHVKISYAVFCLKKKKQTTTQIT